MNKIRTISTRIDSFIKNADLTNSPTLQQIHRDYCDGVMYINKRLALCEDLLQKGKIGEAVILADKVPSLFDLVPLIQAPNIAEFFDICKIYDLQIPPLVNTVVFQSLEKSIKSADVKDALFAELRKLSRSQGSEEKVIILRKIIKLEPENPEWRKQLKQAEATCVPALIQKAQQAITDMDFITLDALEEALSSHEWELVIPDVVLSKIRRTLDEEEQRQLHIRAKSIIAEIEKAYAAQNLVDYNRASSHWKMLCNIDHYTPSEDENHRFAIADAFFQESKKIAAENEEYNNIIREFNGYIQSPADVDFTDIDNLYKRLATFNKEIPANITTFVNQQYALFEQGEKADTIKRGFRHMIFYAVAILILAAGCIVTWFVYNRKNLQRELAVALKNHELKKAEKIVEGVRSSFLPYSLSSRRLRNLMEKYDKQNEELKLFDNVAKELEEALSAPPDESQKIRVDQLMMECRLKATLPSTKKRLAVLENRYKNGFIATIKQKQQMILNEHLNRIRDSYQKYIFELGNAKYSEADDIYMKYQSQLSDLKRIAYFSANSLNGEDKNIVSMSHWLIVKHRYIYREIDARIKDNKFDSLSDILNLYKKNEKALLDGGAIAQVNQAKLPNAAKLEQQYKLAKNDKTLQGHIVKLVQLKAELSAAIKKGKFDNTEMLLKKIKTLYMTAAKIVPVSKEKEAELKKVSIADLEQQYKLAKNDKTVQEHVKKLAKIKTDLSTAINDEIFDLATKFLNDFKALYTTAAKITPISKEVETSLKKFDLADNFAMAISEKKSFVDLNRTFKRSVANLYDNNSRNALTASIQKVKSSKTLNDAQKNSLKALEYQLEYLRKIHAFQKGITSAIWNNQNYPFFRDLANARLFDQKDKEFFEAMSSELNDLCTKYKADETILIAFRDGRGQVKSYSILSNKLKDSLTSTPKNGAEVISFKIDNKLVTIEGNTVTESKEVDGAESFIVYKNVTFLYPAAISRQSISSAVTPHQQLVFSITDKVNKLPRTVFSKEYCALLLELKKQESFSPIQILELYKLLLKPFEKMRSFTYKFSEREYTPFNNKATRYAWNGISKLEQNIDQLLKDIRSVYKGSVNTFDNKYNARIGRLDFDAVDKLIRISLAVKDFRKMTLDRSYKCIGLANFANNSISFTLGDNVTVKSGEIWIYDPDGNTMLAGLCKNGKITWHECSFSKNHTSIVFMPNDNIDTVKKSLEYKNTLSALGVDEILWPAILPLNVLR